MDGSSLLGSGLAADASKMHKYRQIYMQAMVSAQENGEQPVPFEQWMKEQQDLASYQGKQNER